jgi:two-component system CheB/CheR fusion protein
VWPDGTVRWVESQGQCQRDKEGRAIFLMGVVTDVTHRKHAEEAMLRAEKLAVAGRLAASVAHEINNPLEAVTNLLYLITISSTSGEARGHAQNALDELLRVSMITQSMLKFHRQQGTPKITMLSEVVEGVITMFRPRLTVAGITVDMSAKNEVAIACMPSEAQQIFANLIANSIEAMPEGGKMWIRLHPSRSWRDPAVDGMRVTLSDTGVGMDRATMRRIFEPFFTTKPETGTGLGMWVVAQLVERHGGTVRVRSAQRYGASGTAFSIFLPTVQPSVAPGVEVEPAAVQVVPVEAPTENSMA